MVGRLPTHQTDRSPSSSKLIFVNVQMIVVDVIAVYDKNLASVTFLRKNIDLSQSSLFILDCATPSSNCQECLASGSCKNCVDGFALRLMSESIFGFSNVCDGACASSVEPVSGVQVCNTSQGMD